MRRLARQLFTFCSAVSLVLCVAACVLWVRSRGRLEGYAWDRAGAAVAVQVTSREGVASVLMWRPPQAAVRQAGPRYFKFPVDPDGPPNPGLKQFLGFHAKHDGPDDWSVGVPYWFMLLLFAALPANWACAKFRRRRAITSGRCPACGYDLRASPGRCPECGATTGAEADAVPSRFGAP